MQIGQLFIRRIILFLCAFLALILLSSQFEFAASRDLSNSKTFLSTLARLYNSYGKEIAQFRPSMIEWCKISNSCKFCDFEAEMLFMLVREYKPQRVFEMAPNRGYSSHWILQALHLNDANSTLDSFDIHNKSLYYMNHEFRNRWRLHLGDYRDLQQQGILNIDEYNFIFIDALHTEEFSKEYVHRLLKDYEGEAQVVIHDIVADIHGAGRESSEVYKFLAFCPKISNVFTMRARVMPNLYYHVPHAVPFLNGLRAKHGITVPCDSTPARCANASHDIVHSIMNDSPAIFFNMKPRN